MFVKHLQEYLEQFTVVRGKKTTGIGNARIYMQVGHHLEEIKKCSNFKFIKGDICSSDLLNNILLNENIDTVFHVAAQSHVDTSFGNSLSFTKNNVLDTHILMECCHRNSIKKFVNSLKLFGIGYSWGGFESLAILQEIKSSKKDEYLKGRQFYRFKKDEHIVRLHIGLEDAKDLINDLKQGLKKIR